MWWYTRRVPLAKVNTYWWLLPSRWIKSDNCQWYYKFMQMSIWVLEHIPKSPFAQSSPSLLHKRSHVRESRKEMQAQTPQLAFTSTVMCLKIIHQNKQTTKCWYVLAPNDTMCVASERMLVGEGGEIDSIAITLWHNKILSVRRN